MNNYQPNFPDTSWLDKIPKQVPESIIEPLEYEDTIFKDLADDIEQSQEQINKKLDAIMIENAKSERKTNKIATITLIVGILTLIATIIGIVIQFL